MPQNYIWVKAYIYYQIHQEFRLALRSYVVNKSPCSPNCVDIPKILT